jgi:hypothetical protein
MTATFLSISIALSALTTPPPPTHPHTGRILVHLKSATPVKSAWAVHRANRSAGVEFHKHAGDVRNDSVVFEDLPVPASFSLMFETESGMVRGWDAVVPDDDFEEPQPLSRAARNAILLKLARGSASRFADRVVALDIEGNAQHAAVLLTKLRTRQFTGGGYRPGEWVWRVERHLFESEDGESWVHDQDLPLYTIIRRRMFEPEYRKVRMAFSRRLGGIRLTNTMPEVVLAKIGMPRIESGVHVIGDDGGRPAPFTLKPALDERITKREPDDENRID